MIVHARPDDWAPALELVLQHLPAADRRRRIDHLMHLRDEGTIDPAGLILARLDDVIVGAQMCVPLGGSSCLFWLPVVAAIKGSPGLADRLVRAGLDWSGAKGCKLAQAILSTEDAERAAPLVRMGFQRTTRLHYLHHDLSHFRPDERGPKVHFESFAPANETLFRDTLKRSYEATLDCPELAGIRTIDEVLAGCRAAGPWRPELWSLAFAEDRPVGVVLLTVLSEESAWDLSYLGVVPEERRLGHGEALVRHALTLARGNGAEQLILAVDERNTPARRLYDALGFTPGEVRDVYLQRLTKDNATPAAR